MDTLIRLLVSSISWSQWCVWHVAYCCVLGVQSHVVVSTKQP